jgi:hypothetical protein
MEENKYGLFEVESHKNYNLTLLNGFGKGKDASFKIFFQLLQLHYKKVIE